MTRQNPRSTSRTPVARPRRVAGRASAPTEPVEAIPVAEEVAQQPSRSPGTADRNSSSPASRGLETGAERPPRPPEDEPGLGALFDSRRATGVLVALVLVLGVAAGGLFAWNHWQGDDAAEPSTMPVVMNGDDATAGVEAAAKSAVTILTRNYARYDQEVDEGAALMTPAFAKRFRSQAGDVEKDFVDQKIDQQVRVVAQGVQHATRSEVSALLFMDYYVTKNGGDTVYTPYRVLVTVVHTDRGWLVSGIDTQ